MQSAALINLRWCRAWSKSIVPKYGQRNTWIIWTYTTTWLLCYCLVLGKMCLVCLPLPELLSPTVRCQPELASPLQISSTGMPSSPLALERAHIGCKRVASPLRQCCFLSQPKYVTHCSFFCCRQLRQLAEELPRSTNSQSCQRPQLLLHKAS